MPKLVFAVSLLVPLWAAPSDAAAQSAGHLADELYGVDVHGQPFSLASQRGQVSVLIVTSRHTRPAAERVVSALKPIAAHGRAQVACVIDLLDIPRMFHGMAQRRIREHTLTSPIRYLAARDDHWRTVLAADPRRRVDVYIFDRDGLVRGHFDGDVQLDGALRLINALAR